MEIVKDATRIMTSFDVFSKEKSTPNWSKNTWTKGEEPDLRNHNVQGLQLVRKR